jgi:3-dehydroquinate dehydratase II
MKRIVIINGANLNLLGVREPQIYGTLSFESYFQLLKQRFAHVSLTYFQSNNEGEIINFLHGCIGKFDGIIMNAGAYSHTSIAIADAVSGINIKTIEVHISNVNNREQYRRNSYIAEKCIGSIVGLGLNGYALALQHFIEMAE